MSNELEGNKHYCENCGKIITVSKYDESIGGLVCINECNNEKGEMRK